jgi:hypothetical protein
MKKTAFVALLLAFVTLFSVMASMNVSGETLIDFEPVLKNGKIYGIPAGTTVSTLKYAYYGYNVRVYDADGKEILASSDKFIGTGCKVKINSVGFTAVVMGDIDGDGQISVFDYTSVKNAYLNTDNLSFIQHEACEASDGEIRAINYVKLKRAYFGTYDINKDYACDPYDPGAENSGWTSDWV